MSKIMLPADLPEVEAVKHQLREVLACVESSAVASLQVLKALQKTIDNQIKIYEAKNALNNALYKEAIQSFIVAGEPMPSVGISEKLIDQQEAKIDNLNDINIEQMRVKVESVQLNVATMSRADQMELGDCKTHITKLINEVEAINNQMKQMPLQVAESAMLKQPLDKSATAIMERLKESVDKVLKESHQMVRDMREPRVDAVSVTVEARQEQQHDNDQEANITMEDDNSHSKPRSQM